MNFRLEERPPGWSSRAPIQIHHELFLLAAPERVFDVLADSPGWPNWFKGMHRVRIDGPETGVGTLRTVWVGPARVQEHFTVWQPPERITFHVVASTSPGLRVMVEDYQIAPEASGSKLSITVGVEARGPMRLLPGLVRFIVGRLAGGALGISTVFP
ncbi:MAG: SRPBCC family protein [Actinomycetota bacterium]|nr:SRPBCC family protein [Actinomycetota bacterium]